MKAIVSITIALLVLALSHITIHAQDTREWEVDKDHSSVNFSVGHFFSDVTGRFDEFNGNAVSNEDGTSFNELDFTIKVSSVNTANEKRDGHLENEDFFDSENYPEITFVSSNIENKDGKFIAQGRLTVKDVTQTVSLPFEVTGLMENPWNEEKLILGVKSSIKINRTVFGVGTGNYAQTKVIGGEVTVDINLELGADK